MKIKTTYIIFIMLLLATSIFFIVSSEKKYKGIEATIYKSASCGCCGNYIPYLKQKGFEINTTIVQDMSIIKEKYGIPKDMESCHTIIIKGYFIEGHVPLEAIGKLLKEKPAIDGISLPNMPAGSPGMPGKKAKPFVIFQINNGEVSEFMRI